jgi:hypothetical protein
MQAVLKVFLRALFAFLRSRARELGFDGQPGAIVFEQRFSSALTLNPHLHVLVPECCGSRWMADPSPRLIRLAAG